MNIEQFKHLDIASFDEMPKTDLQTVYAEGQRIISKMTACDPQIMIVMDAISRVLEAKNK